jgi:NADPH:quinone reductase-like Zn-dependent oxidoreductase
MKAFVFERTGNPNDVLAVRELPEAKPGPGEILVRVRLSPVHPGDMHIMRGRFGRQPTLPASPGIECVGVVEALGSCVAGPAPGTGVVLLTVWGSWRELIVSPAERVIPVPGDLSDEGRRASFGESSYSRVMTMVEHDLKPGDWLAQTAAGSTVGQLVLQLPRSERFRTVNIVRRRAQVPDVKALGGDVVITSEDDDWGTQLATASEGKALSRAIDCVAGRTGATVARHLAPGGRMLVYGALSSHRQTDPSAFEMPVFAQLVLTDAGSSYLAACKRILTDVTEAERTASGEYSAPTGELAVTTPLGLARIILMPIIVDFLKTYPDIKVRMIPTDQKLSLAQEQIDVAVRIGELPDSSLVAVRVGRTRRVVCASPAYLAARGTPRAPEDLVGHDCISYAGFSLPDAWTFVRDKATITALVHTRLIVGSAEAACAAAAPA